MTNCRTSRRGPNGFIRTRYTRREVDLIVGYCADTDRRYCVTPTIFEQSPIVSLRPAPTRNNQRIGVRWAVTTSSSG